MKKESSTAPLIASFSDSLADHPAIKWLSENGRTLLWILLACLAFVMLIYRLTGNHKQSTERDYLTAENSFLSFEKQFRSAPGIDTSTLNQLTSLLKKHPDLQAKYDGKIAELLLIKGADKEALPFAERTFERVGQDHLSPYIHYAQTTLLVSQKHFAEALQNALNLKTEMLNEASVNPGVSLRSFGDFLYLSNLLRIATLQSQLENREEELKAWNELKQISLQPEKAGYAIDPKSVAIFFDQLAEGKVTLLDYIKSRDKSVKESRT
jgi:hypothetical protein